MTVAHGHDDHVRREALTMALYVSITLIGALTITPGTADGSLDVPKVIWATTVGLAAAHWLAFSLAARLIAPSQDDGAITRHLLAQVGAAGLVAGIATVPVLVLADGVEREGALYATAALVGLTVFGHARDAGSGGPRAFAASAVALALAFTVAALKHALG